MERVKVGNDGTMNDQYHWRKAKPEKFNHSLTQVILNEVYLNIHLKAVETLDFFFHLLEYVITNKKPREKSSFVNDCDLSLVSKQVKTPVLPRKKLIFRVGKNTRK